MFDIEIKGKVQSWNRSLNWAVARGVLEHALCFHSDICIFWDGKEISVEVFNQIPSFC